MEAKPVSIHPEAGEKLLKKWVKNKYFALGTFNLPLLFDSPGHSSSSPSFSGAVGCSRGTEGTCQPEGRKDGSCPGIKHSPPSRLSTGLPLDAAIKTQSSFTPKQLSIGVRSSSISSEAPNQHHRVVLVLAVHRVSSQAPQLSPAHPIFIALLSKPRPCPGWPEQPPRSVRAAGSHSGHRFDN